MSGGCLWPQTRVGYCKMTWWLQLPGLLCHWQLWPQFYLSAEYFPCFLWSFVCLWQLCVPLTALELQFYLLSVSLTSCGALCVSVSDHNSIYLLSVSLASCEALCAAEGFRVAILSAEYSPCFLWAPSAHLHMVVTECSARFYSLPIGVSPLDTWMSNTPISCSTWVKPSWATVLDKWTVFVCFLCSCFWTNNWVLYIYVIVCAICFQNNNNNNKSKIIKWRWKMKA